MRVDCRDDNFVGPWKVIDPATGAEMRHVVWVDDVRREYGRHDFDKDGKRVIEYENGRPVGVKIVTERARAIHIDAATKTVKLYRVAS